MIGHTLKKTTDETRVYLESNSYTNAKSCFDFSIPVPKPVLLFAWDTETMLEIECLVLQIDKI